MRKTIRSRFERFAVTLKLAEPYVVVFGVLLAIIPVMQWYSEADDRRVERIANVLQAVEACGNRPELEMQLDGGFPFVADFQEAQRRIVESWPNDQLPDEVRMTFFWTNENQQLVNSRLCSEIVYYLFSERGISFQLQSRIDSE